MMLAELISKTPVVRRSSKRARAAIAAVVSETLEKRQLLSGTLDTTWAKSGVASAQPYVTTGTRSPGPGAMPGDNIAMLANGDTLVAIPAKPGIAVCRLLPDGQLDPTFAVNGTATISVAATLSAYPLSRLGADQLAVQSTGKIVVAADFYNNTDGTIASPFQVYQLNSDGSLDTAFGTGGSTIIPFGNQENTINAMALTSTGQIVVAGFTQDSKIAVARLNADGSIDQNFAGGVSEESVAYMPAVDSIAIDSQGRVVVAGRGRGAGLGDAAPVMVVRFDSNGAFDSTFGIQQVAGSSQISLVRVATGPADQVDVTVNLPTPEVVQYTSTGALDSTFGTGGVAPLQLNGQPASTGTVDGIAVLPTGEIEVAGIAGSVSVFSEKLSSGGLVETPGTTNPLVNAISLSDAVIQPNGSVVLDDGAFDIVRMTAADSVDTTFGNDGGVVVDATLPSGTSVSVSLLQPDGKLLVGGSAPSQSFEPGEMMLARFNADGSIDSTFGTQGSALGGPSSVSSIAGMVLQPDGDVVLAGSVTATGGFNRVVLERFTPAGSLDSSFGTGGVDILASMTGSYSGSDTASALSLEANGDFLVAGGSYLNSNYSGFVARLLPNGTLDTTFGGRSTNTISPNLADINAMAVDSNGDILLAATKLPQTNGISYSGLARLLPNGVLDNTFGDGGLVNTSAGSFGPLAIQSDGKIVVANGLTLYRYNGSDGSLDTSFNSSGSTLVPFPGSTATAINSLTLLSNGEILAATATAGGAVSLTELTSAGTPDSSFGINGSAGTTLGAVPPQYLFGQVVSTASVAVRPGGSIVVATASAISNNDIKNGYILAAQFTGSTPPSTGSISGNVFPDTNADGLQDNGEGGFAGAVVYLDLNNDGTLDPNDPRAVISSTGQFFFSGLAAGQYTVREQLGPAFYSTTTGGLSQTVTVSQSAAAEVSFGVAMTATTAVLSGLVTAGDGGVPGATMFLDSNGNGLLDPGELSTTTNASGAYSFSNVPNGSYTIDQIPPFGYRQSTPLNAAGIPTTVSNGVGASGENFTDTVPIAYQVIFGTVTLGNVPLSGVRVSLSAYPNSTPNIIAVTDSLGNFEIPSVQPGTWYISQTLPAGDEQVLPANQQPIAVNVSAGSNVSGLKFVDALAPMDSISGTVVGSGGPLANAEIYLDANNNGSLDPGEASTLTNANGSYAFTNVAAGTYTIRQITPVGNLQVTPASGGGYPINVSNGSTFTLENFTDTLLGSVIGKVSDAQGPMSGVGVYLDANNNGILDPGELQATTNAGGVYLIANVPSGVYVVREVVPAGYVQTSPSPTNGYTIVVTAGSQNDVNFVNAGLPGFINGQVVAGSVPVSGATIFLDYNNDGLLDNGEPSVTTNATGAWYFNNVANGTFAIRQILPAGYTQLTPANSGGITITVTGAASFVGETFTDASTIAQITGAIIGTAGSYKNDGNTIAKVFDGNLSTFFDGPVANGDWAGMDFGTGGAVVTQVQYVSRSGYASRMNGGVFQASNAVNFSSGVVNLYTIPANANPGSNSFTTTSFTNSASYRYYRYLSPNGGYGNIAELKFFGKVAASPVKLTGTIIGTAGSYKNDGNTIAKATDGNLSTYFDGASANGNWVGLDLGSAHIVQQIAFAPRSGYASRMVGGIFQASNTADFSSGVVNLYTIATAPPSGVMTTVSVSGTVAYRYFRYLSPNNSNGDIAELAFYGQ